MNINEQLDNLIRIKSQNIETKEDQEKIDLIKDLLKEKDCFFKLPLATAIGILEFLGVKEEKMISFYQEIISYEQFQKNVPEERMYINK